MNFNPETKTFDESVVVTKTEFRQHNPVDLLKKEITGKYCPENIGEVTKSRSGGWAGMHYIPIILYPDSVENAINLMNGVMKFVNKYKLTIIAQQYLNNNENFGIRVDRFEG